ncbi:MAG: hypothetical protein P8M32_09795 [Phycisphaerales bacterium]|nr:hypothetical protein [Phycisphaerales bacterium]
MIVLSTILAASIAASSGGSDVPIRWGLGPVAWRIAHEDCRLTIIGDSNSIRETSPRMLGGLMRTWRPDYWAGRLAPAVASSNEGIRTLTSGTGINYTTRRVYNVGADDPEVWSNGQDGFVPTRGWDIQTDGSGLSGDATYTFTELTRMDEYVGGDWASGHPMRARLVFARDPSGLSQLSYRAHRGTTYGDAALFEPEDASASRAWIDWVDVDVPSGSGVVGGEVRAATNWLHAGGGGPWPCPDNCEAGRSFFHITQVLWRTDVPGLQIDAIAEAGFKAADHLAASNQYDDDSLQQYLAATRDPNVFLLLLGQNMTTAEHVDIEGVWRSHMEGIIERYRAASLANDPAADPMFLLVAPWHTGESTNRFERMAAVLHQIAVERDDSGFINLFALAGSYEHNRGDRLEYNGVHFNSEIGADYFTELLWTQIERELAGHQDLRMPDDFDAMEGAVLGDNVAVHIGPGSFVGGVAVSGENVLLRGWDASTSTVHAPAAGGSTIGVRPGGSVHIQRLSVTGGTGRTGDDGLARGGALHIDTGEAFVSDAVLSGGTADHGGVVAVSDGSVEVRHSQIELGQATLTGGLLWASQSETLLDDTMCIGGVAWRGGGLSLQGGTLSAADVTVTDCVATNDGGGVMLTDVLAAWSTTTVRRCQAETGGGLWVQGGDVATSESRFQHNEATVSGGGIESVGLGLSLLRVEICANSPDQIVGDYADLGENSIQVACACASDFDANGVVDIADLLVVVGGWGACETGCEGDTNGDNSIDADDLLMVISLWGLCL